MQVSCLISLHLQRSTRLELRAKLSMASMITTQRNSQRPSTLHSTLHSHPSTHKLLIIQGLQLATRRQQVLDPSLKPRQEPPHFLINVLNPLRQVTSLARSRQINSQTPPSLDHLTWPTVALIFSVTVRRASGRHRQNVSTKIKQAKRMAAEVRQHTSE